MKFSSLIVVASSLTSSIANASKTPGRPVLHRKTPVDRLIPRPRPRPRPITDIKPPGPAPDLPKNHVPYLKDYESLQDALDGFITQASVPKFVRMAFHDVMNFDKATGKGASQGCIFDARVVAFPQNAGLDEPAQALKRFVAEKFPTIAFPSGTLSSFVQLTSLIGDIVSLAGKVAIEKAFPCIKIAWEFGRKSCIDMEQPTGPGPMISTLAELKPFTDRYGMTPTEMAILTNGAHGIANAINNQKTSGIFSFKFATKSNGTDFIKGCANNQWRFFVDWFGTGEDVFSGSGIGRFVSDMMFFPTTLKELANPKIPVDSSEQMASVEETLLGLTDLDFHKQFAAVYAKMLRLGTTKSNLKTFYLAKTTC